MTQGISKERLEYTGQKAFSSNAAELTASLHKTGRNSSQGVEITHIQRETQEGGVGLSAAGHTVYSLQPSERRRRENLL